MICPNCHTTNREGAKYCDECGFPLTGLVAQNAQKANDLIEGDAQSPSTEIDNEPIDDLAFSEAVKAAAQTDNALEGESDSHADTTPLEPVVLSEDGSKLVGAEQVPALKRIPEVIRNSEDLEPQTSSADPDTLLPSQQENGKGAIGAVIDEPSENIDEGDERIPQNLDADLTLNLAGLDVDVTEIIDERLVDLAAEDYKPNWRDGQTMEMPAIDKDDAPKERSFLASSTIEQKGRKKKIVIGVVVALAVIAAVIGGVTYFLEIWGGKTVPDVTGLTQQEATATLEEAGFSVRTTQVRSDGAEGLVLIEDPVGNSRQAEGSEVVIHISVPRHIPTVIGLTQDEAQLLFDDEGLTNVTFESQRSDEEEGRVLSISPDQGTQVRSSQTVVVKVAIPFTVPAIENMSLSEVENAILDAGLTYDLYYTYTEDYPDYTVLGVSPEVGAKVAGGSLVTINVSRARASQLISATQSLLAAGSTITIGGVNYAISSLDAVDFLGGNQTSYTITAIPFITLLGENLYGTARSVSGTITWNDDDTVSSIS